MVDFKIHLSHTVVRNVGSGDTLVNGHAVSVAALQHGDLITVGERSLRWEYTHLRPNTRPTQTQPAVYSRGRKPRGRRRVSAVAAATPRSPSIQLALELQHRASMPGIIHYEDINTATSRSAGGKQVAIVQPQRRDTTEQNEVNTSRNSTQSKRHRSGNPEELEPQESRKSTPRHSPKTATLQTPTKASMWIESRKTTPRKVTKSSVSVSSSVKKPTPLRLAVLRRAASLTKVQPPATLDQTKQVAIMLMTGHTPKSKMSNTQSRRTPSFLVKKPSPVATPRPNTRKTGSSSTNNAENSVSVLEISDNTTRPSSQSVRSSRNSQRSPLKSPLLPSPRKSAMKDPTAKKSTRKTESIKFDLSNLENHSQDLTNESQNSISDNDFTLHYDTSSVQSPSPRKSIHSRSSKILERSLGESIIESRSVRTTRSTMTPQTPPRQSSRGSVMLQKALETDNESSRYSRRTTKTLTDQSCDTTIASGFRTKTLSPRSPQNNLETYSIVDLVSIDSNESGRTASVYSSAGSSSSSTAAYQTPKNSSSRKTRSTIDPALVESSTPYVGKVGRKSSARSRSSPDQSSIRGNESHALGNDSTYTKRSKSLSTPENTLRHISMNSTRVSRASRKRSRLEDSDLLLISDNSYTEDVSPRSSKKSKSKSTLQESSTSKLSSPIVQRKSSRKSGDVTPGDVQNAGMSTPENRNSPEEVGTPVLSIQSLLDSSRTSLASQHSVKKTRASIYAKRKTIGAIPSNPKRRRIGSKSKSLNFSLRRGPLRLSKDSNIEDETLTDDKMVTPKSGVKLVQEAVKNKHSTAKKPQSKRSIIDDLNESDIVKQLFNSPVKRKLSQSMTEFSRKQLFEDEDISAVRRPTRNTIALTGRTPENSLLEHTDVYTPERFVSPIGSPSNSPQLTGIKRLFQKNSPNNDLTNVKGVKSLLRSPRTRKSVKNDLTDVYGVKKVFARSPRNRLSDVRVKEVFAAGPKNDLRRASGVKTLFRSQKRFVSPKNDITDVRGVKRLFQRNSPANDLRNVSGVKGTLQRNSPRNDLRDVRGVKRMYGEEKRRDDLNDVSGVEELFNESDISKDPERLFDRLLGKPPIKAVYSKSFIKKTPQSRKSRNAKSLHVPIDVITNNVEEWLEKEFQKCLHKDDDKKINRELQKLATDTVEGVTPIRNSRIRGSVVNSLERKSASETYSTHTLPIKKRSLVDKEVNSSLAQTLDVNIRSSLRVSNSLPLKKRVLHSTPLKGKKPSAPALQRMSPIPPPSDHDTSIRSDKQLKQLPTPPKSRNTTKSKTDTETKLTTLSPKQTRAAKTKENILRKTRATKDQQKDTTHDAKKARPSFVIPKKSPILSPKKTRTRRGKSEQIKEAVPNKARGNKLVKPEEVESLPVLSPKKLRGQKKSEVQDDNKVNPKKTRGRKTETEKVTDISTKSSPKKTRGRKTVAEIAIEIPPRRTRAKPQTLESSPISSGKPKTTQKSQKTTAIEIENVAGAKRRKLESPKANKSKPKPEPKIDAITTKRGRGRVLAVKQNSDIPSLDLKSEIEPRKTRKNLRTQESTQSEPTVRRARKELVNDVVVQVPNTRKRKITAEDVVPSKVARNKMESEKASVKKPVKAKSLDNEKQNNMRSKKTATVESAPTVVATEAAPKTNTRNRKVEASPVKELQKVRATRTRAAAAIEVADYLGFMQPSITATIADLL
ncbi:unnamed protein product [Diatraea saccharalis]|uniref:Uncharacterized protein n=1 Tax=Diatraea saccharalis TaxID=40085 RepID=A0A9N9WK79_9NEOP|nr:unnamed protein product [Diatraea saccharalis]